ncbi:IclR family transcriptional regulator [Amycolatopsis sp. GM8]|uniref:IclR family transcriptional regulator n=1 Tax=Amycolatopsis sp. GM8 TaxID=2896530 RepID=UPI001F272DC5|nr:IclR family transcriptional regulator [Amycolatopsis sp. GM8]
MDVHGSKATLTAHPGEDQLVLDGSTADDSSLVSKAFRILDAVASSRAGATISDLSASTRLPRSTVHRISRTLVDLGALVRTNSGLQLGMRLFELGGLVPAQTRLRREATPYMAELYSTTHQTIHLGVLDGTDIVCAAKLAGHQTASAASQMGVRIAAHQCSLGKAILAFAPEETVERIIATGLPAATGRTITSPQLLREQLAEIGRLGVAFDREEGTVGVRCVAAPILDANGESIAAISITAMRAKFDGPNFAAAVRAAALGISRYHGYR